MGRILKKAPVGQTAFNWSDDLLSLIFHQLSLDSPSPTNIRKTASAVKELSDQFLTSAAGNEVIGDIYGDFPESATGYSAYYLLVNVPKIVSIFHAVTPAVVAARRIVDFGIGPGTAAIGALIAAHRAHITTSVDISGIDHSRTFLETARRLTGAMRRHLNRPGQDRFFQSDLNTLLTRRELPVELLGSGDLIMFSNVLSELSDDLLDKLPEQLDCWLKPGARVLFMEPAQRKASRQLLQIRDRLCQGNWYPLYPCPGNYPCPALERPRDWCHHRLDWQQPTLVQEIDALTGMHKNLLNFSPLLMERLSETTDPDSLNSPDNTFRVISEIRPLKGKLELQICGKFSDGSRLKTAMLENKRLSRYNDVFPTLVRYDQIRIEKAEIRGDRLILSETSRLTRKVDDGDRE